MATRDPKRVTWQGLALLAVLGLILSAAFAGVLGATGPANWQMSIHGWVALTLGTFLSLALGIGLMFLVFYSARKGYDDAAAGDPMAPDRDPPRERD